MRKVGLEAGKGKVWLVNANFGLGLHLGVAVRKAVNANFGLGLHLGVAVRKAGKEAGMGKTVL